MSGGHFEYFQSKLTEIYEEIEDLIKKNGKEKTEEEIANSNYSSDWYKKYPSERFHHKYSDEVIKRFREAVTSVKKTQFYIERIDWLLSGDDDEKSFLNSFKKEK